MEERSSAIAARPDRTRGVFVVVEPLRRGGRAARRGSAVVGRAKGPTRARAAARGAHLLAGRRLVDDDLDKALAAGVARLRERPLEREELGRWRWSGGDARKHRQFVVRALRGGAARSFHDAPSLDEMRGCGVELDTPPGPTTRDPTRSWGLVLCVGSSWGLVLWGLWCGLSCRGVLWCPTTIGPSRGVFWCPMNSTATNHEWMR